MKYYNKVLVILSCFLFLCCVGNCQFTTITGTVTDSDGQTWNNGSISGRLQLSGNNTNINQYSFCNGNALSGGAATFSSSISGTGTFSVPNLYDNTLVCPSGTTYVLTICPLASVPCQTLPPISVSGSSMSLTSFISSNIRAPRFPAGSSNSLGSYGYLDVEISPIPLVGSVYYNVTSSIQRIWNGTTWVNNSGGGFTSSIPVPTKSLGFTNNYGITGTYSATDTSLGISLYDTTATSPTAIVEGTLEVYPTPPFTYTAVISMPVHTGTSVSLGVAASLTGASQLAVVHNSGTITPWSTDVEDWLSPTSCNTPCIETGTEFQYYGGPYLYIRYIDDGTNISYSESYNGVQWYPMLSGTKASQFLASHGGYNYIGPVIAPFSNAGGTVLLGRMITHP